ncbi:MAG: FemAB family PEP-CTERM system-associated protein [Sphingomonadales bacterium]|nr:MAG: FemAB family PEP-CTERM system-associated protein [Sphingomonadales bacterium]
MNAPMLARPVGLRVADLDDAIERARIGVFVHDHANGTPFHLPAWSVAVARGCGHKNHYLLAEGGNGQLVGVMPLTEVHSSLFGRALVSAAFGVGGGILADNPRVAAELAATAWALAGRLSCPVMEVRGGPLPSPEWDVDTTRYIGFVRDLAADDDAELLAIPRKQRAEVRKALENDLEVVIGNGAREQAEHYAVYAQSVRNLGTPVFPKSLFSEVLKEFGKSADLLIVRQNGVAVSSVLSLYWNGTVYPYWGGGTREARALRANDRMYFDLMRHARERGCKRFDFGRSKTGTGAAAFKKNWGFEAKSLTYYERVAEGGKARDASPANPKFSLQVKLWSKLPLPVANLVGPWISRGLG